MNPSGLYVNKNSWCLAKWFWYEWTNVSCLLPGHGKQVIFGKYFAKIFFYYLFLPFVDLNTIVAVWNSYHELRFEWLFADHRELLPSDTIWL